MSERTHEEDDNYITAMKGACITRNTYADAIASATTTYSVCVCKSFYPININ